MPCEEWLYPADWLRIAEKDLKCIERLTVQSKVGTGKSGSDAMSTKE